MFSLQRDENLVGEGKEQDEKEKKNRWSLPALQDVLASGQPASLCLRKDMLAQAEASRTWLLYLYIHLPHYLASLQSLLAASISLTGELSPT